MKKIHFRPYNPNQTMLFSQRIDEDIAENDPVRMVDTLVESLNTKPTSILSSSEKRLSETVNA